MRKSIRVDGNIGEFFGTHDANVKYLESLLQVQIHLQDDTLTVDGPDEKVGLVERLISDARAGTLGHGEAASAIDALLAQRSVPVVTQEGWEAIDAAERSAGEPHGRPRVKLAEWDALLEAAGLERAAS